MTRVLKTAVMVGMIVAFSILLAAILAHLVSLASAIWSATAALYIGMAWPTGCDSYRGLIANKRLFVA